MPDPTPPPAAAPAAPAAPPRTTADVIAAATARANAAANPPAPPPAPAPAPAATIDPATLKRMTALERQNREAAAKIATLEGGAAEVAVLREARDLYKSGKRMEAIAKLSGADATAEMEDLLASYLSEPGAAAEATELAKLRADQDAIKARQDAADKARADEAKAEQTAAEKASEAQAAAFATHVLGELKDDAGGPRFVRCARKENVAEAAAAALVGAGALAAARKLDPDAMTVEVARGLLAEAYAEIENEYAALGARYAPAEPIRAGAQPVGAPAVRPPQETPPARQTIDPSTPRAGVSTQPAKRWLSIAEAQAKANERARGL